MTQVTGNLESQRRQYDLPGAATGFASVTVIDDDLGRAGSRSMEGWVRTAYGTGCSGNLGAVY